MTTQTEILAIPTNQWEGFDNAQEQDEWERDWIEGGYPILASHCYREGSRLHGEALRLETLQRSQVECTAKPDE